MLILLGILLSVSAINSNSQQESPITIYIEGNIAAGKSTLISALKKHGLTVVQQPVDTWIKTGVLQSAYENPSRYSFVLLSFILTTIVDMVLSASQKNPYTIFETSPYANNICYAQNS